VKITDHVPQVHADDAILRLAPAAAVLALNTGSLVPLLVEAGLIDDPDAMRIGMTPSDQALHLVENRLVIPLHHAQELLERPGRDPRRIGDGFHALAIQVAQLPRDIRLQVDPVRGPAHVGVEMVKKLGQSRSDPENRVGVHAHVLLGSSSTRTMHRLAA